MSSTTLPWGEYALLRPAQLNAIIERVPVAYVPWGALEWHSNHNPLGLDGLKAGALCLAAAQRTGGVVLPTCYAGTDTISQMLDFPYCVEHSQDTVQALAEQTCTALVAAGFRVIMIVTGHFGAGQLAALSAAVAASTARHPDVAIAFLPDFEPLEGKLPGHDHAALGETSYLMHFHPDTVDLEALPAGRVATLEQDGVSGPDPRQASADLGERMVAAFVEGMTSRVEAALGRETAA